MTRLVSPHLVNASSIREVERETIREFVTRAATVGYLDGKMLDYGCGQQPYRHIIEGRPSEYHAYDRASLPANVSGDDVGMPNPLRDEAWDAILVNQVIQYVPRPMEWLIEIKYALRVGGHLVMTGPTNWPEVESDDFQRFTVCGIESMLARAGLTVEHVEARAEIDLGGFRLSLGWGIIATR